MARPTLASILSRPVEDVHERPDEALVAEFEVLADMDRKLRELGHEPDDDPQKLSKPNTHGGAPSSANR